jgi:glucose-6-phosphate 1-dehydrogenase
MTVHTPTRPGQASQTVQAGGSTKAKVADPCAMVILGASGDLTKRLIIPALYNLSHTKMLPADFALIGVARGDATAESWRAELYDNIKSFIGNAGSEFDIDKIDEGAWKHLADRMSFVNGDLTDEALYKKLGDELERVEKDKGTRGNAIFYLAIADSLFGPVVDQLGKAGLADEKPDENGKRKFWRRVVIEKPFGHDVPSARQLNARILKSLNEDQIYRIDHFLGKDTVQSIMAFRFGNGLFEPIWNRDRIDHVQITAAETLGVEKRGQFYEATGALRDMIPNHAFSLMSMVAMEPPISFDESAIRNKKAELLRAIPALEPWDAVRGQYGEGEVKGKKVQAYRSEADISPSSNVETYAAVKVEIDNWRWAGVPFYLRTGKHLEARKTEIAICFKQAPYTAFQDTPVDKLRPNWLVLGISPEEGISLQFEVKRRGPVVDLAPVRMDFSYNDWFAKEPNVGYETLLYDVMIGDQTLFMRADMVEDSWRIVQPIIDAWTNSTDEIPTYKSGSNGPEGADDLIKRDDKRRAWRRISGSKKKEV